MAATEQQLPNLPNTTAPFVERPSQHESRAPKKKKESSYPAVERRDGFEHRHYVAFHPTCNKLLAKRWEDHARELHYKRLRQAKPTIDNSQPRVYPHLEMRLKRLQMEEGWRLNEFLFIVINIKLTTRMSFWDNVERLHDIERKNHILLDRIHFQMLSSFEVSNLTRKEDPRAFMIGAGDHRRERDLQKIMKENLTILQRIEDKAPNYNRLEWLSDRHRNLGYLFNIAQYPNHYLSLLENEKSEMEHIRKPLHKRGVKKLTGVDPLEKIVPEQVDAARLSENNPNVQDPRTLRMITPEPPAPSSVFTRVGSDYISSKTASPRRSLPAIARLSSTSKPSSTEVVNYDRDEIAEGSSTTESNVNKSNEEVMAEAIYQQDDFEAPVENDFEITDLTEATEGTGDERPATDEKENEEGPIDNEGSPKRVSFAKADESRDGERMEVVEKPSVSMDNFFEDGALDNIDTKAMTEATPSSDSSLRQSHSQTKEEPMQNTDYDEGLLTENFNQGPERAEAEPVEPVIPNDLDALVAQLGGAETPSELKEKLPDPIIPFNTEDLVVLNKEDIVPSAISNGNEIQQLTSENEQPVVNRLSSKAQELFDEALKTLSLESLNEDKPRGGSVKSPIFGSNSELSKASVSKGSQDKLPPESRKVIDSSQRSLAQ
ncbi:hypothetical protein HDU76_013179 [Blyttiomyces sp. JEL0837]|nr:hypothetical protein HDU76_013179 [Blyttiomyces sp. JEL0837]